MLFKKVLGVGATGALVAGALAAMTSPASAATTATYDVEYSCVGFGQTVAFPTKVAVTTAAAGPVANTVSVKLGDFPGIIPVALADRIWSIETGANDTVGDIPLKGELTQSVAGSTPAPLPELKGSAARTVGAEKLTFAALKVTITKTPETVKPTDRATVMDCSVTKQAIAAAPTPTPTPTPTETPRVAPAAPAGGAVFDCAIPAFKTEMFFPTVLDIKAEAKAGKVDVSVGLGDIPIKTVPVALENTPVTGSLKGKIDGQAVTFAGDRTITIPARTDIPVPTMSASVASAKTAVDVVLEDAQFVAKHPMMNVTVDCKLAAPVTIAGVAVKAEAVTLPPAPAPAKATKATVKSVKVAKKSKKATVKVAVKAGKANASGKATIVVKNAKGKTVSKKTVTLKKGAASLTTKKLKAGKYKATVSFKATKAFKKSASKAKSFRVKK